LSVACTFGIVGVEIVGGIGLVGVGASDVDAALFPIVFVESGPDAVVDAESDSLSFALGLDGAPPADELACCASSSLLTEEGVEGVGIGTSVWSGPSTGRSLVPGSFGSSASERSTAR
jgi:hypothetical protein